MIQLDSRRGFARALNGDHAGPAALSRDFPGGMRQRSTFDLISHALQEQLAVAMEETKQQPGKKREVDIPDCPVHSVVVYPDRAEVGLAGNC